MLHSILMLPLCNTLSSLINPFKRKFGAKVETDLPFEKEIFCFFAGTLPSMLPEEQSRQIPKEKLVSCICGRCCCMLYSVGATVSARNQHWSTPSPGN